MLAVTGPSGSGKSTLLTILAGWEKPASGQVFREAINAVTWVAQNPFGVARRTALDHVALPAMVQGATRKAADEAAGRTLRRFGLADLAGRRFEQLSGGEAQRLMLARAVLSSADLVLVDEPTAQLDPQSATAVINTVEGLADAGRIVVVATHDPRIVAVCPRSLRLGAPT